MVRVLLTILAKLLKGVECWAGKTSYEFSFNMLGGTFLLLLVELIRGERLDEETEFLINYAGYGLLVLAAIYLVLKDLKLFILH